jgi:hypothetical protein
MFRLVLNPREVMMNELLTIPRVRRRWKYRAVREVLWLGGAMAAVLG